MQGLSQQELATKTGVSRQTIVKYEKGETDPSISTLTKFAGVLDTPQIDGSKCAPLPVPRAMEYHRCVEC